MVKRDDRKAPDKTAEKDAAARLMKLQRRGENQAEFARRLGLTDQHISNYKGGAGLGLTVLAKLVDSLSYGEVVYVLTGSWTEPRSSSTATMIADIRETIQAGVGTLEDLERRLLAQADAATCRSTSTDGASPDPGGTPLPPPGKVDV